MRLALRPAEQGAGLGPVPTRRPPWHPPRQPSGDSPAVLSLASPAVLSLACPAVLSLACAAIPSLACAAVLSLACPAIPSLACPAIPSLACAAVLSLACAAIPSLACPFTTECSLPRAGCRDIKTENVLMDEDWRPVLADYGFARKVSAKKNMTIVGTDEFMAPEVIWGEAYDERADVFSFGVVMAELFSWKRAGEDGFMTRTPRGKFRLDRDQVSSAIREGTPDAPERLAELILECLAYEPDDRVESADALATLGEVLEEWSETHGGAEAGAGHSRRPSSVARERKAGDASAEAAAAASTPEASPEAEEEG